MRRLALSALALCVAPAFGCGSGPQPPPFRPVVDNKVLMNAVLERQANIVWESVGTIMTSEGTEERRPQTEEEWTAIHDAAVTITEAGNLLMMIPRAEDGREWMQSAAAMIAQGERMIAAIDRKNPKEVFDIGADLYESCVNCHTQYMPAIKDQYR